MTSCLSNGFVRKSSAPRMRALFRGERQCCRRTGRLESNSRDRSPSPRHGDEVPGAMPGTPPKRARITRSISAGKAVAEELAPSQDVGGGLVFVDEVSAFQAPSFWSTRGRTTRACSWPRRGLGQMQASGTHQLLSPSSPTRSQESRPSDTCSLWPPAERRSWSRLSRPVGPLPVPSRSVSDARLAWFETTP
jgi:hypothetical protein